MATIDMKKLDPSLLIKHWPLRTCWSLMLAGTLLLSLAVVPAFAQDTSTLSANQNRQRPAAQKQNQKPKVKVKTSESAAKGAAKAPVLTPQIEERLMVFVEKNHRELAPVLEHMKKNQNKNYTRAMIQIKRAADKIEVYRKRDPQRHEIELESWKLQSRIRLMAAHLALGENSKMRGQLRASIQEELQWRQRRLELEQERLNERMKRIDKQLSQIDAVNSNQLDRMTQNEINKMKPRPKKNKNPRGSGQKFNKNK